MWDISYCKEFSDNFILVFTKNGKPGQNYIKNQNITFHYNFSFIIIQQSLQSHSAQQQVLLHQLRNRLQEYE